jgi:hypothetical protein
LLLKEAALQALAAAIRVQQTVVYGIIGVGVAEDRH